MDYVLENNLLDLHVHNMNRMCTVVLLQCSSGVFRNFQRGGGAENFGAPKSMKLCLSSLSTKNLGIMP